MLFSNEALYTILEAQGEERLPGTRGIESPERNVRARLLTISKTTALIKRERGTSSGAMTIGSLYNFLDLMGGIPLSDPSEKDPPKMRPFALFDTVQQDLEKYLAKNPAKISLTNSGHEIGRKNESLSASKPNNELKARQSSSL